MYRSSETLTDVNSIPYDQNDNANAEPSQTESHYVQNLNLQLNLAVQEKEAATEMLKLSQMTLENLETVMEERRKSSSVDYIKTVKAEYSEAIQLLNSKIDTLSKQVTRLRDENTQYKALTRDLESDNQLLREKNSELENEMSNCMKQVQEAMLRDASHETMRNTLLSGEIHAKEKEELLGKLKMREQENVHLSEKCADLERTAGQMEETLRSSDAKLKEYRKKEAHHLESIEAYVRDINEMKDTNQTLKSNLLDQELESKRLLFDIEQDMTVQINRLTNENTALHSEKASLEKQISHLSESADQLHKRLDQVQISTVARNTHESIVQHLSEVKQQKLFHQHEEARLSNELESLANEHSLLAKSFSGKISLLEARLSSLETVLENSSQHCQQLTEENLEYAQELTQLRSQLFFYHKLFEKNSILSAMEKCNLLEEENETRISELDSYISKYRAEMKSWKSEWQKMTDKFRRKLDFYQKENELLRRQNETLGCEVRKREEVT